MIIVCIYLCLSEKDSFSPSAGKRKLKVINLAQIWKYDISAPSKMPYFHTFAVLEFHLQARSEHNLEEKRVPVQWTGQANTFHSATTHDMVGIKSGLSPYQITDIKRIWNLAFGHQMPGIGYQIYQIYQTRDIGCQISGDVRGCKLSGIGYRAGKKHLPAPGWTEPSSFYVVTAGTGGENRSNRWHF